MYIDLKSALNAYRESQLRIVMFVLTKLKTIYQLHIAVSRLFSWYTYTIEYSNIASYMTTKKHTYATTCVCAYVCTFVYLCLRIHSYSHC